MSSAAFDFICRSQPELRKSVSALHRFLSQQDVGVPIRTGRIRAFTRIDEEVLEGILGQLDVVLTRETFPICPKHDAPATTDDDGEHYCDLCPDIPAEPSWKSEHCVVLRVPIVAPASTPGDTTMANTNPLRSTDPVELGKMKPWTSLRESDFLVEAQSLGDEEMKPVLKKIEEYGICQIRMTAMAPTAGRLLHLEAAIGPACEVQNDFRGKVKSIEPKTGLAANSGDSAERLGFHVDGTQHASTPAILVFQYEARAQFGGDSTFLDVASILAAIPGDEMEAILTSLARSDAATFRKKGMEFRGPIIRVERGSTVSCRLRFDAEGDKVCHVNPACQKEFSALRAAVEQAKGLQMKPREGDIIVFDNWRLMHGREKVESRHQRLHDRMWIVDLLPRLRADYLVGLRGLGLTLTAEVQKANRMPPVWKAP